MLKRVTKETPPASGAGIITVNGIHYELAAAEVPLPELVRLLGLDPRYIVAEYNGEAVARPQLAHITVRAGDRLELVRPVAGGRDQ